MFLIANAALLAQVRRRNEEARRRRSQRDLVRDQINAEWCEILRAAFGLPSVSQSLDWARWLAETALTPSEQARVDAADPMPGSASARERAA